ncbi:hypothetical protein BH11ACT8_BH11ACT8_17220 [soil metagenome]
MVPAYDVEDYLPACLDSLLAQTYPNVEIVVVDDGSPDASGAIADDYAGRHEQVRVVHIDNRGLGGARNEGLRHVTGSVLAFADSDDVVPPDAYAALHRELRRGADLATGSIARWYPERDLLEEPRWMRRLHTPRRATVVDQAPELLGDVFAWNKLYQRTFWEGVGLTWLEGVRYEDQPTLTQAYLNARRLGVIPDVVYHWRIRTDGSSITQQRSSLADLEDRWTTKRISRQRVENFGSKKVSAVFHDRVLPGDLHTYFAQIPGCDDEWYRVLESGVREFFGARSLTHSILPPVQRLIGWLVEHGRREDAALVAAYVAALPPGQRPQRVVDGQGTRLDIPGLNPASVDRVALQIRPEEH